MNIKNSGFSLIELMVVIGIVAVLAAIAVPAYKNYVIGARVSSTLAAVDSIITKSIAFSQTNGRFGNAYDLGLSATSGSGHVDNPAAISPYFGGTAPGYGGISIFDNDSPGCGRIGWFNAYLDPAIVGISSSIVDNASDFGLQCIFWNYQGVVRKGCLYYYGTQSTSQTGALFPSSTWFNASTGTNWDFNNRATNITNLTSYINATCQ